MYLQLFCAISGLAPVAAHVALWDKGMYGKNWPGQDGDSNVNWNNNNPVLPLREADALSQSQWFAHGHKAFPPKSGDFMVLPAGGVYTGEHACNRALTTLRNPAITDALPQYACTPDTYTDGNGVGALHTANKFGSPADPQWFGGTALAIAYTSDPSALQPNDLTVISVNSASVWERSVSYSIPAGLPPCPPGGCLCTWNWIHQAGHGEGYPFEIYNNLYRCTVTGSTDATKKVQRGAVPKECAGDSSSCVKGPKTPMYIYQADGNNLPHLDTPPSYNTNWGFSNGAQNDIFTVAADPAASTGQQNPYATPTVTTGNTPTPTATSLPAMWTALGCMVDNPDTRTLNRGATSASNMTISSCVASCAAQGYNYAGVEYGKECWCGDRVNITSAPSSECNVPCGGDPWAKCGGSYRINVFVNTGAPPPVTSTATPVPLPTASLPSGWSDLGCNVEDGSNRVLNRGATTYKNLTVPLCIADCNAKGFAYAGVEYGQECWCGDAAKLVKATDGCNVACNGDPSTVCGGSWRINVYHNDAKTSSAPVTTSTSAKANATSSTAAVTTASSNTTKVSLTTTATAAANTTATSFPTTSPVTTKTAATTSVNTITSTTSTTSTVSTTTTAAAAPASTSGLPTGWESIGYQVDARGRRVLQGDYQIFAANNTPTNCINYCGQKGFNYAGIEYGMECFCGDTPLATDPSTGCNYACTGNSTLKCGGHLCIEVFRKISPATARLASRHAEAQAEAVQLAGLSRRLKGQKLPMAAMYPRP